MTDNHKIGAFRATVAGLPRIGPRRELKRALEAYWAGKADADLLAGVSRDLRRAAWRGLLDGGVDALPTNTFSYYDQMLDTAALLGALPRRYAAIDDDRDRYFAAARGTDRLAPLEMTKWFDTNYHYLVPEIADDTDFALHPEAVLDDLALARTVAGDRSGVSLRPVIIGPATFLSLAKPAPGSADPWTRLAELVDLHAELLPKLAAAGASWVQFDEPVLATDLSAGRIDEITAAYRRLAAVADRPAIMVQSYFGDPGPALGPLAASGIDGVGLDLVAGGVPDGVDLSGLTVAAGVIDGRNVWRTDLDAAIATLHELAARSGSLAVSTSCSLLHVPYGLDGEDALDPAVREWLAFGAEKIDEVGTLARALADGPHAVAPRLAEARRAAERRSADPRVRRPEVRERVAAARAGRTGRSDAAERARVQAERLDLPALPTTTIGSFPQTPQIRRARAEYRAGRLDHDAYARVMRGHIAEVIELQSGLGLDVLVHGEPERNDMVQYFGELLDGFAITANGWVQSYGSRCVRPPILWGDVSRPAPMTVEWIGYAQSLTDRPVKGMLTGPVTILAWSFVRDDQLLAEVADQVAVAIREECADLEAAGTVIIQVDEPALRELLPLRRSEQPAYLDWAVGAFRLATSGVADATQIHTHLCYSEFGEVIEAIDGLDADVTSVEAARSGMEVLGDLAGSGFGRAVGPGVYDIHSPRVPETTEMTTLLHRALDVLPAERLWVNPDCGLKTRGEAEVRRALTNLVAAAREVRAR
ncbi:5-methyltetrahydropteroyltriglutamate--homocysteine methyltransferase [Naumannella cuiyingiana]|uniref:5-methyltetrahydropteroyltriglutamate--homocysteine methyltransferase n=1 Tax=Naumannella cuiyingiana TaxID=1347891 RepID=A0A7Z0D987_9ACTN|nr:5-methyltetrahydropteroyltriglutamate--homocysteine S-methyltransferase [Naumannella cuiyingiana]NYI71324.1 5-methyltetrahydropteroyltriglutamate--homocysteine methyltransferase [Naumannella cuiyingiana]